MKEDKQQRPFSFSPTPPSPTGKQCGRTFDSLSALHGHMRKRKRGARKPRQEFLCYSEEVLDAATCLLMISRAHPEEEEEEEEEDKRLYRCESCGRTFTTFQALGGHRMHHNRMINRSRSAANRKNHHECSVCREVLASGQALGGHMRKHYNAKLPAPPVEFLFDLNLPAMPEY